MNLKRKEEITAENPDNQSTTKRRDIQMEAARVEQMVPGMDVTLPNGESRGPYAGGYYAESQRKEGYPDRFILPRC